MVRLITLPIVLMLLVPAQPGTVSLYMCSMDQRGHLSCCCGPEACPGDGSDCDCCDRIPLQIEAHRSNPLPDAAPPALCADPAIAVPLLTPRKKVARGGPPDWPPTGRLPLLLCTLLI